MENKKIELLVINNTNGNVEFSHHFHFNSNPDCTLVLRIEDTEYHLSHDGKKLIYHNASQI